jgi:YspA, cpYpsA-related SLOG family
MYIPQVNNIIKVKTETFEGLGRVVYIDQPSLYVNHLNPIQVELDERYDLVDSGHRMVRVNLKEIKPTFKLVVAGGRDFNDYKLLKTKLNALLKNKNKVEIVIVSGGAKGADTLGERYALENKLSLKRFIPDWSIGKQAGYLRNAEMAKYGDACICFHDGESKGTGHMINLAEKHGLQLRIIKY